MSGASLHAVPPPAPLARKKLKVRPRILDQAHHHLGNFLTLITTMSAKAVAQAPEEQHAEVRKGFLQLFGEVVSTMAALDEALHPGGDSELEAKLKELKESREYLELLAMSQRDMVLAARCFKPGEPAVSAMYPKELCIEVALTVPCKDFGGWLLGKICSIGETQYAVIAVEYAPLKSPFAAGAKIKLVVRPVLADGTVADAPGETSDGGVEQPSCAAGAAEVSHQDAAQSGADVSPDGDCPVVRAEKDLRGPQG